MADTDLVRSERVTSHLATGYELRSDGAEAGHRLRGGDSGRRRRLLHPQGHGSLRRGPARRRRQRARRGAQTGDAGRPCSSPTTSPIPGYRAWAWGSSGPTSAAISRSSTTGSCPASTRRSCWLPTTGSGCMAFANGARRGMHWLAPEVGGLLQAAARRPRRGDPHRCSAPPRDLGGPVRLVPVLRPPDRSGTVRDRCRGRGLRPTRPAHASSPEPDTRAVPGLSPAPRRRAGPVRLPDRAPLVRHRHGPRRLQPRTWRGRRRQSTSISRRCRSRRQPAGKNPRAWVTGALGALAVATTATAVRRRHRRPYEGVQT